MTTSSQYELIQTEDEIQPAKSPEKSLDVEKGMEAIVREEQSTQQKEGGDLSDEIQKKKLRIFRVSGPPTLELPETLMSAVSDGDIYAEYNEMRSHKPEEAGLISPLKMDFDLTNSLPYFHPVLIQVRTCA